MLCPPARAFLVVFGTLQAGLVARAAPDEAPAHEVALAVVYDTSASMRQPIKAATGGQEPKHVIARRTLSAITRRLDVFAAASPETSAPALRKLALGLYVFRGQSAIRALSLEDYRGDRVRSWLAEQGLPSAATPLGDAMRLAGTDLLAASARHRHLLVVTDGANTAGIQPASALNDLLREATRLERAVFVHVIALDIAPGTFRLLKERGATLIGAADESQLQAQLDFILENRILLEAP